MNETVTGSRFDLGKLVEDARSVIINPTGFYRRMPKSGGYAEPVIFVVMMAVFVGLLSSLFAFFGFGIGAGMAAGLAAIIVVPVMAVIGSFIGALIMFVIWKLMGSPHGFETAYRSVAYVSALYPIMFFVSLVPYIGSIIGPLWVMYLLFVASQEVHEVKRQTALIVIAILALIAVFMRISSEIAARKMQAGFEEMEQSMEGFGKSMEEFGKAVEETDGINAGADQLGKALEDLEDSSPEEAGRRVGEFLRGMEEAMQKTRKAAEAEGQAQ